ncbi:MAG: hypothetical protein PHR35_08965, partial [Kiritimatiellae bacterium]|nr:hypothetical protein [Kiritimatiellia bacterium]
MTESTPSYFWFVGFSATTVQVEGSPLPLIGSTRASIRVTVPEYVPFIETLQRLDASRCQTLYAMGCWRDKLAAELSMTRIAVGNAAHLHILRILSLAFFLKV